MSTCSDAHEHLQGMGGRRTCSSSSSCCHLRRISCSSRTVASSCARSAAVVVCSLSTCAESSSIWTSLPRFDCAIEKNSSRRTSAASASAAPAKPAVLPPPATSPDSLAIFESIRFSRCSLPASRACSSSYPMRCTTGKKGWGMGS